MATRRYNPVGCVPKENFGTHKAQVAALKGAGFRLAVILDGEVVRGTDGKGPAAFTSLSLAKFAYLVREGLVVRTGKGIWAKAQAQAPQANLGDLTIDSLMKRGFTRTEAMATIKEAMGIGQAIVDKREAIINRKRRIPR